jgi:hypothetical protein
MFRWRNLRRGQRQGIWPVRRHGPRAASDTQRRSLAGPHRRVVAASRLRARGNSVLLRDQPEQARDLRTGAVLVKELIRPRAKIRRAVDETEDARAACHLGELLEGAAMSSPAILNTEKLTAIAARAIRALRQLKSVPWQDIALNLRLTAWLAEKVLVPPISGC